MVGEAKSFVFPKVQPAPTRFRNALSRYRLAIGGACDNCGLCVQFCPHKVFEAGARRPKVVRENLCAGPECGFDDFCCISRCPKRAISLRTNPSFDVLGDFRWTGDLLASTWHMAETGDIPHQNLNYKIGASGGGFDKLRFVFPPRKGLYVSERDISLAISLNRTGDNRPAMTIPVPFYLGGMSYGSISINAMISRVRAAAAWGTFCCTGEGGYPEELKPYDDHVITQVATGLFGVREETIQRVRIVEFKYAQGAKPGLGGHLLGDKVTPAVARMREAVAGNSLFSPFPFHSVYSVEDHKKHIDWIKQINPRALVAVKVSTPTDVDMVAVGSYFAGAHIIQLDGSYGGTGAAPDIAKKNIAMPIEYAVPKVHRFLSNEGIRDQVTLIASGGIRTPHDMAKIIAMGANGVVLGTADMVALECIRCHNCESGRGCARGIATTDPELTDLIQMDWGTRRIVNMYSAWMKVLRSILKQLGMRSVKELVGRWDTLVHLDYLQREGLQGELET
jgi:glutamate synthase domain-containing protein 2/NAD-dependent dihydropyrimidine dehydrogenase PreA subunit